MSRPTPNVVARIVCLRNDVADIDSKLLGLLPRDYLEWPAGDRLSETLNALRLARHELDTFIDAVGIGNDDWRPA